MPKETFPKLNRLAEQLIPKLQQTERHEEALTLNLLYLDKEQFWQKVISNYPFEQQKQMREFGIQACQEAIEIAQILDDKPCQAFYLETLEADLLKSRQLREAAHFYIQALQLYREFS